MNRKLLILTQFIFWGMLYAQDYTVENAFPNISFTDPVGIHHADDGSNRLFVVEQPGKIMVFNNEPSVGITETFLNIMSIVDQDGDIRKKACWVWHFTQTLVKMGTFM